MVSSGWDQRASSVEAEETMFPPSPRTSQSVKENLSLPMFSVILLTSQAASLALTLSWLGAERQEERRGWQWRR